MDLLRLCFKVGFVCLKNCLYHEIVLEWELHKVRSHLLCAPTTVLPGPAQGLAWSRCSGNIVERSHESFKRCKLGNCAGLESLWGNRKVWEEYWFSSVAQSCLTLCDGSIKLIHQMRASELYSQPTNFLFAMFEVLQGMFLFCFTRGQCSKDYHRKPCRPAFSPCLEHQSPSAKTRFDEVLDEIWSSIVLLWSAAFIYRHRNLKPFWQ